MSNYPIGATWTVVDKRQQTTGTIWLESRDGRNEVWKASWYWTIDGSAPWYHSDWFTSYQMARDWLSLNGRAKRTE